MKAICIEQQNDDLTVGSVVMIEDLLITWIRRREELININSDEFSLIPNEDRISLLRVDDIIQDNYCHGRYIIVR